MKEIIGAVAEQFELTKKNATEIVEAFLDGVLTELNAEGKVKLKGIGTLKIKAKNARQGRNPKTGETVQIPAKKVVTLTVEKSLKESVK